MKKVSIVICLLVVFLTTVSNAELIDNGDGTITQTRNDGSVLMWLKDANYAQTSGYDDFVYGYDTGGALHWNEAMTWAETLVFAGYDDWHLPTTPGTTWGVTNEGDLGHMFYDELGGTAGQSILTSSDPDLALFNNLQPSWYWTDNEYTPYPNTWSFVFSTGEQHDYDQTAWGYAWAVRVVPEPISSILFITGGAVLAGRWYQRRKK